MARKEKPAVPAGADEKAVTFKALLSPKQFFSYEGASYQFNDWYFTTTNTALTVFLNASPYVVKAEE